MSLTYKPQRIAIFTAPMGNGHTHAAASIAALLHREWPNTSIQIIDLTVHIYGSPKLQQALRSFYRWASAFSQGRPQEIMYSAFDRMPNFLSHLTDLVWGRRAGAYLSDLGSIDLAIATFPTVGFVLGRRLSSDTPLVVHVTDTGNVNRIWFCPAAAQFALINEESATVARACGVLSDRVAVVGPPFLPAPNSQVLSRDEMRDRLGIGSEVTALFTAGGAGLGTGVLRAAVALAGSKFPARAILNAGDNRKLLASFRSLQFRLSPIILGEVRELQSFISASDLVVGKAGTMTLAESAHIGRPTLIVDQISGHERENALNAEQLGIAKAISPHEVPVYLARYSDNRDLLDIEFDFSEMRRCISSWPQLLLDCIQRALAMSPGRRLIPGAGCLPNS